MAARKKSTKKGGGAGNRLLTKGKTAKLSKDTAVEYHWSRFGVKRRYGKAI